METIKNEILYMKYNGHIALVHFIKKNLTRANEDISILQTNMYVCVYIMIFERYKHVTKMDLINNKSKAFTEISFCSSDF